MKTVLICALGALPLLAQNAEPLKPISAALCNVKRIYVSELTGGEAAAALRELIIAGIDSTKLFVITENPEHADAVLKGAADDVSFEDTFDSSSGLSVRGGSGRSGSSSKKSAGGLLGSSISDHESHHTKERKHEAFATVRLVGTDGDVLWSTTQESLGAKFRGASADVAGKVAHQLALDYEISRRASEK